jgi:hypothetical protein
MSETTTLSTNLVDNRPFIQKVIESEWNDVALITTSIALLVIAVLASVHVFDHMGAMNALYLSYGTYAGGVCLFVAEIIRIVTNCRCQRIKLEEITSDDSVNALIMSIEIDINRPFHFKIVFVNGLSINPILNDGRGKLLLRAIDPHKIHIDDTREMIVGYRLGLREYISQRETSAAEVLKDILQGRYLVFSD